MAEKMQLRKEGRKILRNVGKAIAAGKPLTLAQTAAVVGKSVSEFAPWYASGLARMNKPESKSNGTTLHELLAVLFDRMVAENPTVSWETPSTSQSFGDELAEDGLSIDELRSLIAAKPAK